MSRKYNKLPDTLFRVRVPIMCTYSDEELAVLGLPLQETSSGKLEYVDEDMVAVMLPLTRIIDIYSMGAPIRLIDADEIAIIYRSLSEYISEANSITPELNAPMHNDNRDIDIDRFASEVFNLNKSDIVNTVYNQSTGFNIGFSKIAIPNRPGKLVPGKAINITESYASENQLPAIKGGGLDDVYLTHDTSKVDPETVERKPIVRRRRRIMTPPGVNNVK